MKLQLNISLFGLLLFYAYLCAFNRSFASETLRTKAEQGDAFAQCELGLYYLLGLGVNKDEAEAAKWLRRAAEQQNTSAQSSLGSMYLEGRGVPKDYKEGIKWLRKAAEQGDAEGQRILGEAFRDGLGVPKNGREAFVWLSKAADQGGDLAQTDIGIMFREGNGVLKNGTEAVKWLLKAAGRYYYAQYQLGQMYSQGDGVPKDDAEAYKWYLLASAGGNKNMKKMVEILERTLTPDQRAEGQRMAREFKQRSSPKNDDNKSHQNTEKSVSSGSGFFITDNGYLITNQHVASEGATVRVLTSNGELVAKVVKVDKANDLALLKTDGRFSSLPVISSRRVRLGSTAATVGFPNVGLQGFSPKLAKGEIASLAGAQDDARHFQISVPVQPGNSGGALVDEHGNVIGVIVAKLSQKAALATTGTLAENVNYAVKSSYLLSFLESVPEVAAKLKEPVTADRKFEDVIRDVEQAAVLVLVY
jgi:TPR repeat protein